MNVALTILRKLPRSLCFPTLSFIVVFGAIAPSCREDDFDIIVPAAGYEWPSQSRDYWPTNGWQFSDMSDHGMDALKMGLADEFAENDPLSRAVLVVKDGYLVFEKYYHGGQIDASTNLHSVTKSFGSALVGFLVDDGLVESTDQRMGDLMPDYPAFQGITLRHALTHTTGLSWTEEGWPWENWVASEDWVAEALDRGFVAKPGRKFKYSSGNSHFLTSLIYDQTGIFPGDMAKERLFDPLGIAFEVFDEAIEYRRWSDYVKPLSQSWRKDTRGIEIAATCLYLTARDMAKFGYLYLNRGMWDGEQIIPEAWVIESTQEHVRDIYGRYSYGYQWWITLVGGQPAFLASGYGGQIIGVVPSYDLVVVLKYDALNPVHPKSGTAHDDMYLFELIVRSAEGST